MTIITLHGEIAEAVGRKMWKLKISSIREAMHAIDVLSNGKLLKYLINASKESVEYKILTNEKELEVDGELSIYKPETIVNSELMLINKSLKTLDIVPIIKGAGGGGGGQSTKGILAIVLGVLLIATGIGAAAAPAAFGLAAAGGAAGLSTTGAIIVGALVGAGISLAVTGITLLTMQAPKFDDFRKIDNGNGGKPSYLFDGPTNILGEGGPVPIGYGRMKIGSQTVEVSVSSYEISSKLSIPETRSKLIELQQQNI